MLNLPQLVKSALIEYQRKHQILHSCQQQPEKLGLVLAYSGGLDSHVLLHVLAPLCRALTIPLKAVHVHHGLNQHADQWATFCRAQCELRQVEFNLRYVQLDTQRNIEQQARTARYQALAEFVDLPTTALVTAHHADDQLETLLLALKRGSGLMGLAAMPAERPFAAGTLLRPLLAVSRQQLYDYAVSEQLSWVDDDSNQNTLFDRNFIRQHVTPVLKQRWPSLPQTAARSVQHLQQAAVLADYYTEQALQRCRDGARLDLRQLVAHHPLQQDLVLRRWLGDEGLNPETQWLITLKNEVIKARADAQPKLALGNLAVCRYQHWLYLVSSQPITIPQQNIQVSAGQTLQLGAGLGVLTWHQHFLQGAVAVASTNAEFQLAYGLLSQLFKPAGKPSKPLKQWFKLWQVPPWQRGRVPLLLQAEQIQVVAGYASSCPAEQSAIWLNWQPAVDGIASQPVLDV